MTQANKLLKRLRLLILNFLNQGKKVCCFSMNLKSKI